MNKGEQTRKAIVERALDQTSLYGLSALSIGALAKDLGLSKSGLFAHFGSKTELELQVLMAAREHFVAEVIAPALCEARGLPRVRALVERWVDWGVRNALAGGCPFVSLATELDDQPGPLRDAVVQAQRDWLDTLAQAFRIAVAEGHMVPSAEPEQLAFEIYSQMLGLHLYARLLRDPRAESRARRAFDELIARHRPSVD